MNTTSELLQFYNLLYDQSILKIKDGNVLLDKMIDNNKDRRRGLTLLIRPDLNVIDKINRFQKEIKKIDEHQYYQPVSDIHLTVLSIIPCYEGFNLADIAVQEYVQIITESIKGIGRIKLNFNGITTSPEAVLIQGFPVDRELDTLRNRLRENFARTNLQHSIDSRYKMSAAHVTAIRFREMLVSPERFAEMLQRYREVNFGEMRVKSLDLVYNDWYQSRKVVKMLYQFIL
jgi:2'-5' RNA ligase